MNGVDVGDDDGLWNNEKEKKRAKNKFKTN